MVCKKNWREEESVYLPDHRIGWITIDNNHWIPNNTTLISFQTRIDQERSNLHDLGKKEKKNLLECIKT